MPNEPISFSERLKKLEEERARERGDTPTFTPPPSITPPPGGFKPQDIPDVLPQRSDDEIEMDKIISNIDIISAYKKWCNKSEVVHGNRRTEGIKISCPKPDHPDRDPSAWINTEKNTWYCGGCAEGGDTYDIAAYHFGYPVPGYKDGQQFHKLREQMAESFGWHIKKVPGGTILYQEQAPTEPEKPRLSVVPDNQPVDNAGKVEVTASPEPSSLPASTNPPSSSQTDETDTGNISEMFAEDAGEEERVLYPRIDWRNLVPQDTFLYEYLKACCNDDSPEEYHFWNGLLGLGHAVGRKVTLDDNRPVYGNLLLCLLGGTGVGKSRSNGWLHEVVKAVMPYKETGQDTTGVKMSPVPASGEYLVKAFSYEGRDPVNSKLTLGFKPVNGIVDFDEMSGLLARANRPGATLKSTIMAFADARDEVRIGSLTHGDSIAAEPFCSITASTQPRAVRTILNKSDTGSGFLNRWIFAGGPSKEREVLGGSHSDTVIDLAASIELLKLVRGWGGFERSVKLDDDALAELTRFYKQVLFPIQEKDDTDLLKRLDLLFKKIILLFAVNERLDIVPVRIVEMAEKLFKYVVECYGILDQNIGITLQSEIATLVLNAVRKHCAKTKRGASARDISRYLARRNYSPNQIRKTLEDLVALDFIELEKKNTGMGRPTARYMAIGDTA